MAYFLFVDESGQDHRESPYEVLAGVSVEDRDLWNLVKALQDAELRCFGTRYSQGEHEIKGKKFLKTKTFRLANKELELSDDEQRILAKRCLEVGEAVGQRELTALARAKLKYVNEALTICTRYHCRAFASIVDKNSPPPDQSRLRKDYKYLFERFFYFLKDTDNTSAGIIVFDELERSRSHILVNQMDEYFKRRTMVN